jgi:regulator of nucleoside diphosphate kinase
MPVRQQQQQQQHALPAETLSSDWAQLHARAPFTVNANELHYLKTLAVALDDDVVSLLLLKKLRLAKESAASALPDDLVVMNSILTFAFGGDERQCRLAHPSACRGDADVSIASRIGAGLIGLSGGQTVLWPDEDETLRPLRILAVEKRGCALSGEGVAMAD